MTARLASNLWVSAYLHHIQAEGLAAYVTARGDPTAGAIVIKCATLDGRAACHERVTDWDTGASRWQCVQDGPEAEIDALISRQRARDPDLWVIEVESRDGRTLLEDPGLGL